MKGDFYMVLPSNSSMDYYPSNTASRYTTLLPKHIELPGEWAIGLSEIQFPCNFLHIRDKSEGEITLTSRAPSGLSLSGDDNLPVGVYSDIESLISSLSKVGPMRLHFKLQYDKRTGFVQIRRQCDSNICDGRTHALKLSDKLLSILGFPPGVFTFPGKSDAMESERPVSLSRGLPESLFVYSDLCTPYVTGDVQSSLLRIVPFSAAGYTYGSTHCATFSTPHYIPLIRSSFRTIEIDIRSNRGELIPFEYGPLNVTLHFKRIY